MFKSHAFGLFVLLLVNLSTQNKVKVSIYYEALCPDSMSFITRQLLPAYAILSKHINVEFVPYGKAIHNFVNGEWKFECQHGAMECYGNKMHACALHQNANQDKTVEYIGCVMAAGNPASNVTMQQCARTNGAISWIKMLKCRDEGKADNLLAGYGEKTFAVEPQINFVPSIIYNDGINEDQRDIFEDFLWMTCQKIGNNKPANCPANRKAKKLYYWWN